jgi:MFS family permease
MGSNAMTLSVLLINVLNFSGILFPGMSYQSIEIGVLLSSGVWASAFSTLVFGILADRLSRCALFSIMMAGLGAGCIANAFVPADQGMVTFSLFVACNILRGAFSGGIWPVIASFTNDALQKDERSKFFALLNIVLLVLPLLGMVTSALLVEAGLWKLLFAILGIPQIACAVLDSIWLAEPKRGLQEAELHDALANSDKDYAFKLTRETLRSTVFSSTNVYAILEGVFTAVVMGITDLLIIPYMQAPPHNISSLVTSIVMIVFATPGVFIGSIGFAGISDRFGKRHVKYRIYLLVLAIVGIMIVVNLVVFMPLARLDITQGNDIVLLFSLPVMWAVGLLIVGSRILAGLYNINQPVILQEINLPESQGLISSINNFTAGLGSGAGPVLAGLLLTAFNQGFQAVALICIPIGCTGAVFWLLATRHVDRNLQTLSDVLKQRAQALEGDEHGAYPETEP